MSANARTFVDALASNGRHLFTSSEAQSELGISPAATKLALNRLAHKGRVASPARGFYVIVPPEYRALGCLPPEQFIPELMKRRGLSYYAGLLTAAQYHGAAHHRPQAFQVFLEKNRRPIQCGAIRVLFLARKRIKDVPLQKFNTPRGTLDLSTPEATAIDLVGYYKHAGGLDNVVTILRELAEKIAPARLVAAARTAPISWAQRLGYLLELSGTADKTKPLRDYVQRNARRATPLLTEAPYRGSKRHEAWKLYVNTDITDIEAES